MTETWKNAQFQCMGGFSITCSILQSDETLETFPACPVTEVRVVAKSYNQIVFADGSVFPVAGIENNAWVALIRAGMVPGKDPVLADKLEACTEAQANVEAALSKYFEVVESLELRDNGNLENTDRWLVIPELEDVTHFPLYED